MEKYANDGYNMKEQFRKNISTLHNGEIDPNIKKYFERKRRRERERAQKKALANALNDGNANDDDEEEYSESDYGDEENPHGSSSDEDDFSNLDQNNVYHRLKFKLESRRVCQNSCPLNVMVSGYQLCWVAAIFSTHLLAQSWRQWYVMLHCRKVCLKLLRFCFPRLT